jgi:hypothetical protein
MKKYLFIIILISFLFLLYPQQNKNFLILEKKDLATFSDGITLLRLLYNETDTNAKFVDNILWAVDKKLFQVSIPIKPDTVNPVLTRGEFSFWICRIFNARGGIVNTAYLTRYSAFKTCTAIGLVPEGRGYSDTFSGEELMGVFNYIDNFIRTNKIKPKNQKVLVSEEGYNSLPKWRENLYKELEQQRAQENANLPKNKKVKPEKIKSLKEKFIDKDDLSITK